MKKIFWVDIPDSNAVSLKGSPMVNITNFKTREEAIQFAQEYFGADENGNICLVSESDAE